MLSVQFLDGILYYMTSGYYSSNIFNSSLSLPFREANMQSVALDLSTTDIKKGFYRFLPSEDQQQGLRSCTKSYTVRSVLFDGHVYHSSLKVVANQTMVKFKSSNEISKKMGCHYEQSFSLLVVARKREGVVIMFHIQIKRLTNKSDKLHYYLKPL